MLVKQELVKKVKDYFDLNIYETKVWLALLSKGIASAGEIASISGVPRSRTYDVLEGLEKKGFALVKIGKPVKYIGVKPNIILEKLKKNVMKDAGDKVEGLSKIKETDEFQKLEELYKGSVMPEKRENVSASLKGKSNISNQIREILENAEKEIIICTDAEDINSKLRIFAQTFERLKKANIKINAALSGDDSLIKELSKKLDVKFKKINIDTKFFIADKKEILFYVSKDKEEELAIWLNSDFFVLASATLFEKAVKEK
jgi:HTH-type transcriptional regulator, sugar sensing transcriptional regulator